MGVASPTQQPVGTSAGMLQAKQLTGLRQPQASADKLPKDFLSPQTPVGMPPDMALPTRGPRPSSTHQWAGMGPALQQAFTSLWTASPTRGQTPNARKPQSCRLYTAGKTLFWDQLGPSPAH